MADAEGLTLVPFNAAVGEEELAALRLWSTRGQVELQYIEHQLGGPIYPVCPQRLPMPEYGLDTLRDMACPLPPEPDWP